MDEEVAVNRRKVIKSFFMEDFGLMMRHKNTDRFVILQRFLGHEVAQSQARSFTRFFNYKWFNYYLYGIKSRIGFQPVHRTGQKPALHSTPYKS